MNRLFGRPIDGDGGSAFARYYRPIAIAGLLLLAACTQTLSPREQAKTLTLGLATANSVALAALQSPLLADKPEVRLQIKAATHFATASVVAFDVEAAKCLRNADGIVVDAHPDVAKCEPGFVNSLATVAQAAVDNVPALLASFGIKTE